MHRIEGECSSSCPGSFFIELYDFGFKTGFRSLGFQSFGVKALCFCRVAAGVPGLPARRRAGWSLRVWDYWLGMRVGGQRFEGAEIQECMGAWTR